METKESQIFANDFFSSHQYDIDVTNGSLNIRGKSVECILESRLESLV